MDILLALARYQHENAVTAKDKLLGLLEEQKDRNAEKKDLRAKEETFDALTADGTVTGDELDIINGLLGELGANQIDSGSLRSNGGNYLLESSNAENTNDDHNRRIFDAAERDLERHGEDLGDAEAENNIKIQLAMGDYTRALQGEANAIETRKTVLETLVNKWSS